MTCERLSDRMVDVAHGGGPWSAEESLHLASCADCAEEWRIATAAARLGESLTLDGAALASKVHRRLESEPKRRTSRVYRVVGRWSVGLAAAAVLILAVRGQRSHRVEVPKGSVSVLHELDDLRADELEKVLRAVDVESAAGSTADPSSGDLTPSELERVLRSLEG